MLFNVLPEEHLEGVSLNLAKKRLPRHKECKLTFVMEFSLLLLLHHALLCRCIMKEQCLELELSFLTFLAVIDTLLQCCNDSLSFD